MRATEGTILARSEHLAWRRFYVEIECLGGGSQRDGYGEDG